MGKGGASFDEPARQDLLRERAQTPRFPATIRSADQKSRFLIAYVPK